MTEQKKSLLGQRTCPTCGESYTPTAAEYAYRPRGEAKSDGDGESRLESVTYFGDCPKGHVVCETVTS